MPPAGAPALNDQGPDWSWNTSRFNKAWAKIKDMVRFLLCLTLFPTVVANAEPKPLDDKRAIERINRRYDDFFRYQEHLEARDKARDHARSDLRHADRERAARLERARLAYVQTRRAHPNHDAELEAAQLREKKRRDHEIEAARENFVRQQTRLDSAMSRGRTIPGNKEFGLDE